MTELTPELSVLVAAARGARELAYAPYSSFLVGAALLTEGGETFRGCNVENASYGATVCAERTAVFTMVAAGSRRVRAIAVFTDAEKLAMPCGMCRQVLAEFARDLIVVVANPRENRVMPFSALFPEPFVLDL